MAADLRFGALQSAQLIFRIAGRDVWGGPWPVVRRAYTNRWCRNDTSKWATLPGGQNAARRNVENYGRRTIHSGSKLGEKSRTAPTPGKSLNRNAFEPTHKSQGFEVSAPRRKQIPRDCWSDPMALSLGTACPEVGNQAGENGGDRHQLWPEPMHSTATLIREPKLCFGSSPPFLVFAP
jgi:hypothetical protein